MRAVARLTLVLLAAYSFAAAQSTDIRGIYLYTNDVSQITAGTTNALTTSLGITGVDGIAIVIGWDAIEPSMGQFQWALLDQWINIAISRGKKIDLVVPAGDSTPAWLFQAAPAGAGATPLNFTVSPHAGATGVCQTDTIAAPVGSGVPRTMGRNACGAFGAPEKCGDLRSDHAGADHGDQSNVGGVAATRRRRRGRGIRVHHYSLQTWQPAGYKPSLLLHAGTPSSARSQKSFPDKTFAVSIIPERSVSRHCRRWHADQRNVRMRIFR